MKEIKLTKGQTALVDDEDYEYLNQFKWYAKPSKNGTFYANRVEYNPKTRKSTHFGMHREILGVTNPKLTVDHKDFNGLNNQKTNIRIATWGENQCNKPAIKNKSSRYKGVYKHLANNKDGISIRWFSIVSFNKQKRHLGFFKRERDAAIAYNEAALEMQGEFAYLNEIPPPTPEEIEQQKLEVEIELKIAHGGKWCNKCKQVLPKTDFFVDNRKKSGLTSSCKKCGAAAHKEYIGNNRDKNRVYQRRYQNRRYYMQNSQQCNLGFKEGEFIEKED